MAVAFVTVGLAAGFVLGRFTTGSGDDSTVMTGGSADPSGMSEDHSESRARRRGPGAGRDAKPVRGPAIAIRNAVRKLELSPMAGMDYDSLFDAYEVIRWMSPEEVRLALNELEDATGNLQVRMVLQMMLISRWAKQDGRGAVEYAMETKQSMHRMSALMGGLTGWAKSDPEAAYTWYQEHRGEVKGGMMGEGMMDGIFFASMAQQDMGRAFELLKGLKKNEQQTAIMMMSHGSSMDPASRREFLAGLEQLEDKKVRAIAMEGLVSQWVMQDPEGAVEFVESREWEEELGEDLRETLVGAWAHIDPEAALDWRLSTAGEGEDRGESVAPQFSQWMAQDAEAATKWLERQPENLRTDTLYGETSDQLRMRGQHEVAAAWAEQIEDDENRGRSLGRIYREWKGSDEEAAQEWFDGLDASMQAELEKGTDHQHPEEVIAVPVIEARHGVRSR